MSLISVYFVTRQASDWGWDDFLTFSKDEDPSIVENDLSVIWINSLDAIIKAKGTGEAMLLKADQLKAEHQVRLDSSVSRPQKRAGSAQERRVSKRNIISSWKNNFRKPWDEAPFESFNSLLEGSMAHLSGDAKNMFKRWAKPSILSDFAILGKLGGCFEECEHLSTLVQKALPDLKEEDFKGFALEERDYIWLNIILQ